MSSVQDHHASLSLSEEDEFPNEPGSSKQPGIKRGTRACDRCRRIKSKCEPGSDDRCKNCEVANTPCTFQGPSFKRGPPKGYIHSIEQRWHQVECILATIMESPRAQDIIADLRNDPFASAILDRVQAGPYGLRNRMQHGQPTSESFYSSLIEVPEHTPLRDDRRSRRQSRVSREIVSQDPTGSATPTREWQEHLARRLAQSNQWAYTSTPVSPISRSSSSTGGGVADYSRTRRRLDNPYARPIQQQNWDGLYTLPDATPPSADVGDIEETAEAFGHLSVDENKEFRYHGPASGLPLLAQSSTRKDSDNQQIQRIWKFTGSENPQQDPLHEEDDVEVEMPSPETQKYLLELYFAYVHPFFPVIHKQDFLQNYHASVLDAPAAIQSGNPLIRTPMQRPCKMLLLAMFAIAARYSSRSEYQPTRGDNLSFAGQQYAQDAHKLLDRKYQSSRPSTCQALLLLAIREFGMGAMDKGWLYSGMALRMAIDLGMNRNADNWTTDGKQYVFTEVEKQIRKHIWWSCCISDKLSAVWLGRPITFRANDYSTPLLDVNENDENELWQPYPPGVLPDFIPREAKLMTTFREACRLSIIITDIMDKIYPVQVSSNTPRRVLFEELESRLNKWLIELPDDLRYPSNDRHATVLPHVLMLHIEYYTAVLLLHRAFLPPYDANAHETNLQIDPLALKAFDVCAGAAVHMSSMTETYSNRFGLERAPPFLCIFLQSAGIMHVVALGRRPSDPQASIGLTRCIEACKQIERTWPTATRLRTLLEGAKVHLDKSKYPSNVHRHKRSIEDALSGYSNSDAQDAYVLPPLEGYRGTANMGNDWDTQQARMAAHSSGVAGPSTQASTSFYPGYQWWPSQLTMAMTAPVEGPPVSAPMSYGTLPSYTPHPPTSIPASSHAQLPQSMQGPFTFNQGQMSQDFVQGVSYPSFNFDRYAPSQPGVGRPPDPALPQ
ncbi:fungal-specific transcription factor domain-containing protein [Dichomitus squalens]|uniref:Fungal-specific transcription factor domain-containing protein n=1 Tax=Dichomitus squalens TaxID=114155 RepID=A0A4Q9N3I1_9APHY|nr:fungal-specific transcription factor domain-containing protein [Dichomitus squalens]